MPAKKKPVRTKGKVARRKTAPAKKAAPRAKPKKPAMQRIDLKAEFRHCYTQKKDVISVVNVPEMGYLMIDGQGDPSNSASGYMNALQALYALFYTMKFSLKKSKPALDIAAMPLESLWWADVMNDFATMDRNAWKWTAMIALPAQVTPEMVEAARGIAITKKNIPELNAIRYEKFREGFAAQILHIGPFESEGPSVQKLHEYIAAEGYKPAGKHHELYFSDPSRTKPEAFKTILRQPIIKEA